MNYLHRKKLAFMSIVNGVKGFIRNISGIPPLTLSACVDEDSLISYKIYGDSVQDGTSLPDNPIEVVSVGEKTKNLVEAIDGTYPNVAVVRHGEIFILEQWNNDKYWYISMKSDSLDIGKTYTLSFGGGTISTYGSSNVEVQFEDGTTKQLWGNWKKLTFTVDSPVKKIQFVLSNTDTGIVRNTPIRIMLEEGSTVTDYEPYGYKIPITARAKNLFDKNKPLDAIRLNFSPTTTVDGNTNIITAILGGGTTRMGAWIIPTNGATDFVFSAKNISIEGTLTPTIYIREADAFPEYISTMSTFGSGITQIYASTKSKQFKTSSAYIAIVFQLVNDGVITFDSLQIEEGTEVTDYEPYVEPITTNIYLDKPLGEGQAISYPSDNLPKLPTFKGTTIYEIDTDVQPSNVAVSYYSSQKGE